MASMLTQTAIALLIVPCIPVLIYVIGILIPESHFVCRTMTYKTKPRHLWELLTNVHDYPTWQSKLDKVVVDSVVSETPDEGRRVIFVEHSKRNRRTVMQHIEQQPYKTMLRVLEERITTAVSLRSPVPTRPHVPTFTGSWTFELTYPQQGDRASSAAFSPEEETLIQLKITEQGVVKKPLVRLSNLLLFGFHRRIDRFMKDLERCLEQSSTSKDKVQLQAGESTADDHPIETPDTTDDHTTPTMTSSTVNDTLVASQSASAFLSPRSLDKDWDLVSEIYERQT